MPVVKRALRATGRLAGPLYVVTICLAIALVLAGAWTTAR